MFQSFFTSDWLLNFDMQVYKIVEHLWSSVMDNIMIFITHLGDEGIFFIALCIVLLLFKKTRKIGAAAIIALGVVSLANSVILKDLFERVRPYGELDSNGLPTTGYLGMNYWLNLKGINTDGWTYSWRFSQKLLETSWSFPSGHTASSFAAAVGITYIDKKKGIPVLILAFLIGLSRIYLHVHYPSDVIAGMIIGIVVALIACVMVFKVFGKVVDKINAKTNYKLFPKDKKD